MYSYLYLICTRVFVTIRIRQSTKNQENKISQRSQQVSKDLERSHKDLSLLTTIIKSKNLICTYASLKRELRQGTINQVEWLIADQDFWSTFIFSHFYFTRLLKKHQRKGPCN